MYFRCTGFREKPQAISIEGPGDRETSQGPRQCLETYGVRPGDWLNLRFLNRSGFNPSVYGPLGPKCLSVLKFLLLSELGSIPASDTSSVV